MSYPDLAARLAMVQDTIHRRQQTGGWSHPVRIVAVTKTHGPEAVQAAWEAGIGVVGENRVQEALAKQDLTGAVPVEWHLIGPIQRNKVRQLPGRFALLQAVDRESLVEELGKRIPAEAPQPILLEVNCSGEAQKAGVAPAGLPALVEAVGRHPQLRLQGLMTMAPFTDDEAVQRQTFRRLRDLRDALEARGVPLPELSMGMSGDFGVAAEEGATMVRLGTVLFGERST